MAFKRVDGTAHLSVETRADRTTGRPCKTVDLACGCRDARMAIMVEGGKVVIALDIGQGELIEVYLNGEALREAGEAAVTQRLVRLRAYEGQSKREGRQPRKPADDELIVRDIHGRLYYENIGTPDLFSARSETYWSS